MLLDRLVGSLFAANAVGHVTVSPDPYLWESAEIAASWADRWRLEPRFLENVPPRKGLRNKTPACGLISWRRRSAMGNELSRWPCVPTPEQRIVTEAVMTADRRPLPDDLNALREIIGGRPADPQTMQRLIKCNLVEEFNGTALLTTRGIKALSLPK